MTNYKQSDVESWRLIVLDHEREHVMITPSGTGSGFSLPAVEVPVGRRTAEMLTGALKRDWHCSAICLFTPESSAELHYEAVELLPSQQVDPRWEGVSVHDLATTSFQDQQDLVTLQRCLIDLGKQNDPTVHFTKRGWIIDLQQWVNASLQPLELKLTGEFQQLNASPSFSLIRFETTGPDVWFKAVGEPNLREFPITLDLSQRFPEYLPKIIEQRPDWNAWLTLSAGSETLDEANELRGWEVAVSALAKLQIESIPDIYALLDAGAHDLRMPTLSESVRPFLQVVRRLMREQTKVSPEPLSDDELSLLDVRLRDAITLLEDLRVPTALGHLDLNPGNIVRGSQGIKFLDWAEAYVGHPFFSFEYLLAHWRRTSGSGPEFESALRAAYCQPWVQILSPDVVSEAFFYVPIVALFAYAVSLSTWRDERALLDPNLAGYIRSLARRMNREAVHLVDRSMPCLS